MSRSLHTQKLSVRAERRLSRPYSKRRQEACYLSGRFGIQAATAPTTSIEAHRPLPQLMAPIDAQKPPQLIAPIEVQKPLPRLHHPVSVRDVRALLGRLGPTASYGLKSIRLRREAALRPEGIVFAEYAVPGRIDLFALPECPWRLPFQLHAIDRAAFEMYGAHIEIDNPGGFTIVYWGEAGLARFVLTEVLAHELGHHLFQHHRGKRSAKLCRHSDHERRADLHSRRVRKILAPAQNPK